VLTKNRLGREVAAPGQLDGRDRRRLGLERHLRVGPISRAGGGLRRQRLALLLLGDLLLQALHLALQRIQLTLQPVALGVLRRRASGGEDHARAYAQQQYLPLAFVSHDASPP
jgi:hypothetical protein